MRRRGRSRWNTTGRRASRRPGSAKNSNACAGSAAGGPSDTATAPGVVEAIVARCLVEPAFLEAVRARTPRALAAYALADADRAAFQTADLGRLRHFSGISSARFSTISCGIVSRQPDGCCGRHGIELEVFARYRGLQLAPESRSAGQDEKIRRFLSFLEDYLAGSGRYPSLQAVMRHERAIWEIRQAAAAPSSRAEGLQTECSHACRGGITRLVPRVDGVLRIETFDCDPVALTDRVLADAPPRRLRRRARLLVYWTDRSAAQLRTLTVETLPALLLSQVNGRRPVGSIVASIRRHSLAAAPPSAFRPFFEDAVGEGLISLAAKDG